MHIKNIVNIIINESNNSLKAVRNTIDHVSHAIPIIMEKIKNDGKVIYICAGCYSFDYVMCGGKKALYASK